MSTNFQLSPRIQRARFNFFILPSYQQVMQQVELWCCTFSLATYRTVPSPQNDQGGSGHIRGVPAPRYPSYISTQRLSDVDVRCSCALCEHVGRTKARSGKWTRGHPMTATGQFGISVEWMQSYFVLAICLHKSTPRSS